MDKESSPFLRADYLISSLKLLGDELRSFQPFFSVYVTELQVLVGRLAESQDDCAALRRDMAHISVGWEEKLRDQHVALSHEIRALSQEINDNKITMRAVQEEGERLKKLQADVERDRKQLQLRETEWMQSRRVQEQVTVQIAQRNQHLQERITPLEDEARMLKLQAEALRTSSQNTAHRATAKEKDLNRVIHHLSDKITRQEVTVDEANSQCRRLAASIHALRNVKDGLAAELTAAKDETLAIQTQCNEKLRCMTPRPDFDSCPQELLGSASSSSAAKVETLVGKLRLVAHNLAYCERSTAVTSAAFSWLQKADASSTQSVLQMPAAEVALVPPPPPPTADDDASPPPPPERFPIGAVPMMFDWPAGVLKVMCKAVTLADVSSRAKELLDHCNALQGRTSRHVELSMSMLAFFLEGVALGDYTSTSGQYPVIPASHTNKIPMSVYEYCMNVLRATQYFSTEPCLRAFGCIVREELGAWVWGHHKKVIQEIMVSLTAQEQLTATAALALLQELLDEYPTSIVLAVQRAVMQSVMPSGGTLVGSTRSQGDSQRRLSGQAASASLDTLKVRVVWDRDSALESGLMRRLRTIFLEATLAFFRTLEKHILSACQMSLLTPQGQLYDICSGVTMSLASLTSVVASAAPALSAFQVSTFVADVFELATASARQEAAALKTGLAGFDYLGPNSGPASTQLFLPGRADHFYGTLRPYPQLVTTRVLANRKQAQSQRRRVTVSAPRKSIAPVSPAPQALVIPPISVKVGAAEGRGDRNAAGKAKASELVLPLVSLLRFIRKVPLPPTYLKGLDGANDATDPDVSRGDNSQGE